MSVHYQSINGLWFSAFQRHFSTEKITTFVSYLMMHLPIDSLAFQGLAEQLQAEWPWHSGQVWSDFTQVKRSGARKPGQGRWHDCGSAKTFVPGFLIQIRSVANVKRDFQGGTWSTSISENKLYNQYQMGLCWQFQQRSQGFDIPEHQTVINPFM